MQRSLETVGYSYEKAVQRMTAAGWRMVDHQVRTRNWKWTTGALRAGRESNPQPSDP
jgi:hypothetical protein